MMAELIRNDAILVSATSDISDTDLVQSDILMLIIYWNMNSFCIWKNNSMN